MMKLGFALLLIGFSFNSVQASAAPSAKLMAQCGHVAQTVPWDYCITKTENSRNNDIVYLMHGAGADEKAWTQWPAFQGVRDQWEKVGFQAPIIVTVSFGPVWLLADRNASPQSGLFAVFTKIVMPYVEQKLLTDRVPSRKRRLLGMSMGGFNSSQLVLKMPGLFKSAVLACPAISAVSPYAPQSEVDDYVRRTGANKDFVGSILSIAKNFFPDEVSWQADAPLRLAKTKFGAGTPPLYISCGTKDEGGFYEGAETLAKTAQVRGANVKWESLAGGHCVMNSEAIADFLVKN